MFGYERRRERGIGERGERKGGRAGELGMAVGSLLEAVKVKYFQIITFCDKSVGGPYCSYGMMWGSEGGGLKDGGI